MQFGKHMLRKEMQFAKHMLRKSNQTTMVRTVASPEVRPTDMNHLHVVITLIIFQVGIRIVAPRRVSTPPGEHRLKTEWGRYDPLLAVVAPLRQVYLHEQLCQF